MYSGVKEAGKLASHNTIAKYTRDMSNNPADEFNANSAYLMLLTRTMENWTFILYYGIDGNKNTPDFYEQLISCCDVFIDLMSARVKPEHMKIYEEQVNASKKLLTETFRKDSDGMTRFNIEKSQTLLANIRTSFRGLMNEMQRIGMLTKLHLSPSDAITEME